MPVLSNEEFQLNSGGLLPPLPSKRGSARCMFSVLYTMGCNSVPLGELRLSTEWLHTYIHVCTTTIAICKFLYPALINGAGNHGHACVQSALPTRRKQLCALAEETLGEAAASFYIHNLVNNLLECSEHFSLSDLRWGTYLPNNYKFCFVVS